MTTQLTNPAYRTKIVNIETHDPNTGNERLKPVLVFPKGVGPSANYGFRAAVEKEIAAQFKPGQEVYLELRRGNLKPGVTQPKWATEYYWDVKRLEPYTNQQPPPPQPAQPVSASPTLQQELPPHPAEAPAQRPQSPAAVQSEAKAPMPMHDPDAAEKRKEDATNRRTALMQAVAALPSLSQVDWVGNEDHVVHRVARLAQGFYETLLTLHAPEPEAAP